MQCPTPLSIQDPSQKDASVRLSVPCGKCGACKQNRRSDWSFRLKQELRHSVSAYFITITYDDENLPYSEDGIPTLVKKHWQNFVKRIRKDHNRLSDYKLRYYAVGEYGSKTGRPHYHALVFNLDDRVLSNLARYWPDGYHYIGVVEDASIHYVAKFHVNTNKEELIDENTGQVYQRTAEFAVMSRRPGIGAGYLDTHTDWHLADDRNFVRNNGYIQRLPRYYKNKIFEEADRKRIAKQSIQLADENYIKEIDRLSRIRSIDNPTTELYRRQIDQASKYRGKGNENDTF